MRFVTGSIINMLFSSEVVQGNLRDEKLAADFGERSREKAVRELNEKLIMMQLYEAIYEI